MDQVGVLGPVQLVVGGRVVPLAPRTTALLAALSLDPGRVVSVDRLAGVIFGDRPPARPAAAVQTLVSRLRRAGAVVERDAAGYRLRATSDADRFEALAAAGQYDAALALWRGPAYAGCDHADQLAAAAHWERRRTDVREARARADLAAGRTDRAVAELTTLASEQPYRESTVATLIEALAADGRTTEALAAYRLHRNRLRDEFGLDPSPALAGLQQRLLAPPAPTGPDLVGREHDLDELRRRLDQHRLVTLTGPGGVGKTALARAVAGGAVWCELAAVQREDALAPTLLTALGMATSPDPTAALAARLRRRRLLLVLDNAEQLAGPVGRLTERLLRHCPELRLLVTSRTPLQLPVEQVHPVTPLPPGPAGTLLRTLAARCRPETPADATTPWTELATRLDGLPLALELAAGRLADCEPAELLAALPWRFTVLRGGPSRDPRHRTLRALVDSSYALLEPDDQRLFVVVSAFAGPFTAELAAALAGQPTMITAVGLSRLAAASMITVRRGSTTRYVLLQTLRDYGRAQHDLGREHAELISTRVRPTASRLYTVDQAAGIAALQQIWPEIRQACAWSLEHDHILAGTIIGGLRLPLEQQLSPEVAAWSRRWADHPGTRADPAATAVRAAVARFDGDLARCAALCDHALAADPDPASRAYLIMLQAEVALFSGDLDRLDVLAASLDPGPVAIMVELAAPLGQAYRGDPHGAARRAGELADRQSSPVLTAWAGYIQGECLIDVDPARAAALLAVALARAERLDERYLTGVALTSAASVAGRHGDPAAAARLYRRVVAHWADRGDRTHQWTALRNVVQLWRRTGRSRPASALAGALARRGPAGTGFGLDARLLREAQDPQLPAHPGDDDALVDWVLAELVPTEEAEVVDRQHLDGGEPGGVGVPPQHRGTEHGAGTG